MSLKNRLMTVSQYILFSVISILRLSVSKFQLQLVKFDYLSFICKYVKPSVIDYDDFFMAVGYLGSFSTETINNNYPPFYCYLRISSADECCNFFKYSIDFSMQLVVACFVFVQYPTTIVNKTTNNIPQSVNCCIKDSSTMHC